MVTVRMLSVLFFLSTFAVSSKECVTEFISADAFEKECQLSYGGPNQANLDTTTLDMQKKKIIKNQKPGDCIFVNPTKFKSFFKTVHPYIKNPYILCSSSEDLPVFDRTYLKYINDPKIIKCFMRNINIDHPKVIAIPIGMPTDAILSSYYGLYRSSLKEWKENINRIGEDRNSLLYINFSAGTHPQERCPVLDLFKDKDFTKVSPRVTCSQYLMDLKKYKLCLSPAGNGVECYRTWEAMYSGCIPIIRPVIRYPDIKPAKGYDKLYHDLPVIVIENWEEVTEEFLYNKLEEFKHRTFNMEKLYFPYWRKLIQDEAKAFKRNYI